MEDRNINEIDKDLLSIIIGNHASDLAPGPLLPMNDDDRDTFMQGYLNKMDSFLPTYPG